MTPIIVILGTFDLSLNIERIFLVASMPSMTGMLKSVKIILYVIPISYDLMMVLMASVSRVVV